MRKHGASDIFGVNSSTTDCAAEKHTTATLSRILGVDGKELTVAFRRHLRCTPAEYQRTQRLDLARKYLAETDHTIGRIAANTGFCDQAYLFMSSSLH